MESASHGSETSRKVFVNLRSDWRSRIDVKSDEDCPVTAAETVSLQRKEATRGDAAELDVSC